MSKLLYITANPKTEVKRSKGAQIGEVFLETFQQSRPDVEVERLHLYSMDIGRIDEDLLYARAKLSFMGYSFEQLSEAEQNQYSKMQTLLDQFINADYYVFVTPLWNFGTPAIMKDYMDNMFKFGETFTRTEEGTKGLLTNRKAVHIQTRGGIYAEGPMKEYEMGDHYLDKTLSFLGMEVMKPIIAEGLDHLPKQVPEIMAHAKQEAEKAAIEMANDTVTHN
ncbi:FMN-dependent NADH-azoreductase [Aquibacillus sediminis]|uniref:FMN-dependent NADH-azoreductase n=1 Tax=Aquibacillus sediminis TaxID=2574734 RepID=UPI00110878AD|nr:NAD(P)H-dependent oxidoreductase [Aquibacillus sediminis]